MQVINISSMILGAGMMLGSGYPEMWTFFARMGLGVMFVVMQKDVVKQILVQNNIIRKDMRIGPVVLFTTFIIVGLVSLQIVAFAYITRSSVLDGNFRKKVNTPSLRCNVYIHILKNCISALTCI
jgi:hypothetical protein